MGGSEAPYPPPPGPVFLASAETPAAFPQSPLEVPWTDSHSQVTGIPLTVPFTTPQIQMSALKWRLSPGLIETRPLRPPPSVSSNREQCSASPPWDSSNKDQLPALVETKGLLHLQADLPFLSSLPATLLCLLASS